MEDRKEPYKVELIKDLPEDSLPFINTQVEVEILVRQPQIRQEEIDRVKDALRGYSDRVTSGEISFGSLARLYSQDEGSRRQGGEMPYISKVELDPAFANVAFSLSDPKKVSKVVESEFGYHIIQLIDKNGDKIRCRHILLKPEVMQEDIDTCLTRLDTLAQDIRAEKVPFEIAASEISDDKDTRNNHGLMSADCIECQSRAMFICVNDLAIRYKTQFYKCLKSVTYTAHKTVSLFEKLCRFFFFSLIQHQQF